ncbi:hypothetical protein HC766_01335 [Candidatus Gracilibacteria bacterium]|nr:hypothetical protein [Candidatus Gracilibacteria bacterium]
MESFRQFRREKIDETFHVHLGYVPFLACSGEYKTKPMQRSIRELLRVGLQPDVLIVRSEATDQRPLDQGVLDKIALFGNLDTQSVISLPDLESIYNVPVYLRNTSLQHNLEGFLNKKLKLKLPDFYEKYGNHNKRKQVIKVGLIVKYTKLEDSYLSVLEALKVAAVSENKFLRYELIDSEDKDLIKKGHGGCNCGSGWIWEKRYGG